MNNQEINEIKKQALLVAVSKTRTIEEINAVHHTYKIIDFGENKVQELLDKHEKCPSFKWHFIGHLQTNKVKQVIDKVILIHSLDRLNLVQEIQKQAQKRNLIVNCLIQVNLTNEKTKSGVLKNQVDHFLQTCLIYSNLCIQGLMIIGPTNGSKEEIKTIFEEANKLFISIKKKYFNLTSFQYLSMGMSEDYEIALEAGSNIVRIGSKIFGPRTYQKETIFVSSCLLGKKCKYNGEDNYNEKVVTYLKDKSYIDACPEQLGGLSTPRLPCECLNNKVINSSNIEVTEAFQLGAKKALEIAQMNHCQKAILKSKSPSCGYLRIYDGTFTKTIVNKSGFTAEKFIKAGIKIITEIDF